MNGGMDVEKGRAGCCVGGGRHRAGVKKGLCRWVRWLVWENEFMWLVLFCFLVSSLSFLLSKACCLDPPRKKRLVVALLLDQSVWIPSQKNAHSNWMFVLCDAFCLLESFLMCLFPTRSFEISYSFCYPIYC